jgi:hypothetical protein
MQSPRFGILNPFLYFYIQHGHYPNGVMNPFRVLVVLSFYHLLNPYYYVIYTSYFTIRP